MQSRTIYSAVSILLLGVGTASAQTSASINFATTYQTIRGYGTSTAWQPVLNSTQANNLFGTGPGQVGLTILRSRIDPGSTTGGSNWATERANAQQAQAINSQVIVFATPWTPPAVWKSNGSVDDGSLITADYDNFANYLNAFIAYEKAGGVNLYAISVQNEPDFLPDYESCGYSGAQMDAFVAREGGKINTRLMMPESDTFNTGESDPTLNDPNAVGYVSIVAGHTYGTKPFYYTNAKNHGKDVWMTEVTYTPAAGSNAQPTISDAISAAELYHQSMAVAQYNAYVYWWTPLLLNGNSPNYYAYALGQYSKFVRPGYVMTGANNNPTSGVYVTSYTGNNNYVIVAINSNGSSSDISFNITGATLTSVTPYQTSASNQLAKLNSVSVSNDSFTYSLPGQSITTFVGTGGGTCTPTAIIPYISVGGTWTEESSATVSSTSTVTNLGPQPLSGGSWSWTGPHGFTSTSREIDNIPLSAGANVYTATYTNSCGDVSTQTFTVTAPGAGTPITPYVQVNGGAWQQTNTASAASGSTVNLGPQPVSGGSWSWTGPNGFTSTSREIDNIPLSPGTDTFVATYTNTSGVNSSQTFTITVTGGISATSYYTIVNEASGSCVDDSAGGISNGTVLQQYACSTGNPNQEWRFTASSGGYYEVTTHNSSTVGWNVIGAGTAPGTGMQLYTYYGGLNAQFEPVLLSTGYYQLKDRNSGLCLNDPNGTTANGQQLQINTCNASTSESWALHLVN
jgi:glucuronoarabinoxylan endo-1,4-beta-xylanase